MRRVIAEKIIVYSIFIILCMFSINYDTKVSRNESNRFNNEVNTIANSYNYIKDTNHSNELDLKYINNDKKSDITLELRGYETEETKIISVDANFNGNYSDNVDNYINICDSFIKNTILKEQYKEKINNLISQYKLTKTKQEINEYDNDKQVVISVSNSEEDSDYLIRMYYLILSH